MMVMVMVMAMVMVMVMMRVLWGEVMHSAECEIKCAAISRNPIKFRYPELFENQIAIRCNSLQCFSILCDSLQLFAFGEADGRVNEVREHAANIYSSNERPQKNAGFNCCRSQDAARAASCGGDACKQGREIVRGFRVKRE